MLSTFSKENIGTQNKASSLNISIELDYICIYLALLYNICVHLIK